MRTFLFSMAVALCGVAHADDLQDVNKLLEAKSYPQAIRLLDKLAHDGRTDAQWRLGQIYWYGEGVAVDREKADALFAQAAAAGNKDAQASLGLTAARQQHLADIAHWTSAYDGADLKPACAAPVIPEKSTTNDAIQQTQASYVAWQSCHNAFAKRVADLLPAGKQIPPAVLELMTDAEVGQATSHLNEVYTRLAADSGAEAQRNTARFAAWQGATVAYVTQENKLAAARQKEIDDELAKRKAGGLENAVLAKPAPRASTPSGR